MKLLEEIKQAIQEKQALKKANDYLKKLIVEIDQDYAEILLVQKKMEQEYAEYEKLENGSIKSVFYKILGSKEKQLEKERQEYLRVSLRYDELKDSLKLKEYERDVLAEKAVQFNSISTKIERLKVKREQWLLKTSGPDSVRLRKIIAEIDDQAVFRSDLSEAHQIGTKILQQVDEMIQLLGAARNWGRWDMQSGRSRMYKYRKHTNLDRAKQMAYQIQQNFKRLTHEVRDVYPDFEGFSQHLNMDSFNGFTNIFFDNLITDWIMQQKIVNALNSVKGVRDRLMRLNSALMVDFEKNEQRIDELEFKKDDLIVGR